MLEHLLNKTVILASKSPRRQELLKGLDIDFEIKTKEVDESYPDRLSPFQVPVYLAEKKADAFMDGLTKDSILITSDTIVVLNGEILEKPKTLEQGKEMIRLLSGNEHTVVTGVCVRSQEKSISFSDETKVLFTTFSEDEIDYYINKYKPFDKAGSYGVQEWIGYVGIEKLEGSYYNVMGLPVHKLYAVLKDF
ncbi:MAG: Maf family nucleotide pyrophosphatase [Crocinitomicaceae bacterium]